MQPNGDRPVIVSFRPEHLLGWVLTFGLCLVPVVMWVDMHPLATIQGFPAYMLNIGRVAGLVGMVMYALNLVYATRFRFLEYLFGGLNRVYIAHHLLGGLALIFLTFHPLFLSLRFVQVSLQQAALLLLPNGLLPFSALFQQSSELHGQILEQWAITFGIIAFWGMVVLLLVTFFIKIPYRLWLMTHKFLGVAFFFGGLHVLFINSDTSKNGPLKYYILTLTAIGLLAFTYKTLAGKILIKKYQYVIGDLKTTGGDVTEIYLKSSGLAMDHKPGQFVFVRFPESRQAKISGEWHPFSISSAPGEQYLRLSVKGLGDYTKKLNSLQKGALAEVEGAYGKFTYTNFKNLNQIWVAGGIGITPFLSMARSLPDTGYKIDLYYSVKTTSELVDWDALVHIAEKKSQNFRIIPYVGDQQKGYLDVALIESISGSVKDKEIFICGPPTMMKSLRKQFKDKMVPGTNIHTEEFGMS